MKMTKFTYDTTKRNIGRQSTDVTTLIQYKNKLFRVTTHLDRSYDFQSYGRLEYFNGTDFIKITGYSHNQITADNFFDGVERIIDTYEKFMPHEETKA